LGSSRYKSGKNKAFPKKVSKFFGKSEIIRTFAPPEPAKPLNDAQMCGSFYLYTMSNRVPFQKSYTNAIDLVKLLQSRGLTVTDTAKAERYIEYIGYYRLSAYMYPLLRIPKDQHLYKPNTSFDQVMMLYRFDKKLRLFIFNEIEKIEVAVRSAIVNIGSDMTGNPFWMTDSNNFIDVVKFQHTMDLIDTELRRSREDFIVHFKQTYSDPYPPAWILAEVLPFGVLTNIYSNIRVARIKKRIAQRFGLQVAPFESWLTIVALTRNSCCHHARVWNKQNTIRPMMPNRMTGNWISLPTDPLRVYFDLCIIKYFLNIISPQNDMTSKLKTLLYAYPGIDIAAMGFPQGWENEPVWQ
jgi:abortive infection bacteriophage resistance protein